MLLLLSSGEGMWQEETCPVSSNCSTSSSWRSFINSHLGPNFPSLARLNVWINDHPSLQFLRIFKSIPLYFASVESFLCLDGTGTLTYS